MKIKDVIGRINGNIHLKQTSALFTWNLIGLPINLAINFFMTRYLGAEAYGNYSFVARVFNLVFILMNLGLFRSVGRAILLSNDNHKIREYYGTGLIIWIVVSTLTMVLLYPYALLSKNVAEKGMTIVMLSVIPFCAAEFLNKFNEQVLPSSNKIKLLIVQRYGPRILLLVLISLLFFLWGSNPHKLIVCLCALYGTQFLFYSYVAVKLRPTFTNRQERFREIKIINRSYGAQTYIGDLFSNVFTAAMPLLISLFSLNNAEVGFYSLALMLCTPMNYIPSAIMTSYYKMFSTYKEIPRKVFKVTILSSAACLLILWVIIAPFVKIFYTPEYNPVIFITMVTSVGTFLYGLSDFISRYLSSQGDGVALRNSSIIVGFSTLVCSLLIIPKFAAMGAAITHVIAGIIYVIVIIFYYRKRVKTNNSK